MKQFNSLNRLPQAVQRELMDNLEKQSEEQMEVRSSKFRHARTFLRLKKKYNFKVLRLGMN